MSKLLTDSFTYEGIKYELTWIPGSTYKDLSPITQAYGVCFDNNGKLLVVHSRGLDAWQIPGGTPEGNETPEEALIREVEEEANAAISDLHYLGSQKVVEPDGKTYHQLRFAARILSLNERKIDPDKQYIIPRKLINPEDYRQESGWGEIADAIIAQAKEKLEIK